MVAVRTEFAADSPLEGDGFEPSVPHKKQPFLATPVRSPQFAFHNKNRLFRARNRWFESISLQRRVQRTSSVISWPIGGGRRLGRTSGSPIRRAWDARPMSAR